MSTSTAAPVRKTKRDWGSLFSTVGIVLIVIYCLAPFYWMLVSSLRPDSEIFENSWWPRHPSFENYKAVSPRRTTSPTASSTPWSSRSS